ncbi:hypothetical protein JTB14_014950 [Gonioctena quinquepunctata]|nr:hypothetical protein JTB14_014950 [Gonioctena quinquepunctata]
MSSKGEKLVALARAQAIESSEEEFEEDSDDSVKDKDYVPSSDEDEEDLEIVDTDDFEEQENDENIANNQQTQATDNWGKVQQSYQNLFDKKCEKDDVFTSLVSTTTRLDFFKLFVTDDLVDLMVEETNRGDTTSGKGHADAVVEELMERYAGEGQTLFVDNFYTSIPLANYLLENETYLCGTIRKNRGGFPKSLFSRKVKKGNLYGMQKGSIKIIKWTDKKSVCMLSTREDHNDTLIDTAKVRNGESVQKPKCVVDYNKAKKGVDYSDQMSSYQNVLRKGMKWYRKVEMEIIFGAAMTNTWILHNAKFTKKQLSILDFKDMVCKGLFEHSCESEIPRPRTPKRIHTLTEGGPDAKKGANGSFFTYTKKNKVAGFSEVQIK